MKESLNHSEKRKAYLYQIFFLYFSLISKQIIDCYYYQINKKLEGKNAEVPHFLPNGI